MAIRNAEINSKLADLAALIEDCKRWAQQQPGTSLGAHLATYVDVCLLGVLEESVEVLFRERAQRAGDSCVANYIEQDISQSFRDPKFGRIRDMLGRFDPSFAAAFEKSLPADSPEMRALVDVNTIKQNISHLGVYDVSLTLVDVEGYYHRVVPILEAHVLQPRANNWRRACRRLHLPASYRSHHCLPQLCLWLEAFRGGE